MSQLPSENAREAAERFRSNRYLRYRWDADSGVHDELAVVIQQAIDSATAAKEREIEKLSAINDANKKAADFAHSESEKLAARVRELDQMVDVLIRDRERAEARVLELEEKTVSNNCIHCVSAKRTGIDLLCDTCRTHVQAAGAAMPKPLELLLALCPKLEEDVLMALRFLYYIKAKSVVPDARYDEAEKEYLLRDGTDDSLLMNPGSDNPVDYPPQIHPLALYLALAGAAAGQATQQPKANPGELF